MGDKKAAARAQIRETLISLIQARDTFKSALLADHQLPAWVYQDSSQPTDPRTLAAQTSLKLTYDPDQPGQETLKLTGLIGISATTLALGEALNESKTDFKEAIQNFRRCFGKGFDMTELSSKDLRESVLGNLHIQHIHFVQSYRQLKLFPVAPRRVGFSWASATHGSVRMDATKAIAYLHSNFTSSLGIAEDITHLEKLSPSAPVVIRRPLAPHLRANLTWPDAIQDQRKLIKENRKRWPGQINTPLPLFIQLEKGAPLPEFNKIRPWDPAMRQERLQRSDTRLVPLSNRPGSMVFIPA
ncbi:hypothetical protein [Sansalvadorimonas verongulae]|uniref:hypothetical protein n=1 Tax=Sansalvadorimonas verongulae TaxID=2172824 RepID=UPI0012BD204C|nr:hypothetical protein [Sansalvadorimonas verongulae]MTI12838.1 hypothetical protein [Sansalvadorimonas verongulae]